MIGFIISGITVYDNGDCRVAYRWEDMSEGIVFYATVIARGRFVRCDGWQGEHFNMRNEEKTAFLAALADFEVRYPAQ